MQNQTSTEGSAVTVTTVPVVENKSKRTRGPLNKKHLRSLSKAEGVVRAALLEQLATALAAREITAEFVNGLAADINVARGKTSEALHHSTTGKTATLAHTDAEKALQAALQEVQKAAKQKYARTNRLALGDYFVGKKLNGSVPNLAQTSQTILNKLAEDQLPGVTAAKIQALGALRQSWLDSRAAQAASQAAAQTTRAELKALMKSIEDRRVAIQLAADAEWPHTEEANVGIRGEFGLQSKQPLKV